MYTPHSTIDQIILKLTLQVLIHFPGVILLFLLTSMSVESLWDLPLKRVTRATATDEDVLLGTRCHADSTLAVNVVVMPHVITSAAQVVVMETTVRRIGAGTDLQRWPLQWQVPQIHLW